MARDPFASLLRATGRAIATAHREGQRNQRAAANHAARLERQMRMADARKQRELARIEKEIERANKQQYLEDRLGETQDLNDEVEDVLREIEGVLVHTLKVDDTVSFNSLRLNDPPPLFKLPDELKEKAPPSAISVSAPTGLSGLMPWVKKKYEEEVARAQRLHVSQMEAFEKGEVDRKKNIRLAEEQYERSLAAFSAEKANRDREVDSLEAGYRACDVDAVLAYNEMVLARSEYPSLGFPQNFRIAYKPADKQLVIEYELPESSVIPDTLEYKYVKSKDIIESKPRKPTDIKRIYQDLIASITLRTIHEVFEADQAETLESVSFTGVLDTTDPATGNPIRVPVVSVRASKTDFMAIRLDKVDKALCLKNLGARVSGRPDELQAVKPVIDFNMVDPRFVDQSQIIEGLESRPNLLELSPSEFEALVANLFGRMGLETKLTRSSRDGGVDAVAYDLRPVLGGKVVIQAKRYKDTVGVSAVRDLFGTMMNEGASKGILVCTSSYGADAYNFVKDKPIELVDGGGLLYLLGEHAGVEARISS